MSDHVMPDLRSTFMTAIDPNRPQDYQTRAGHKVLRLVPVPESSDPYRKIVVVADTDGEVRHWSVSINGQFAAYSPSSLDIIPRPASEAVTPGVYAAVRPREDEMHTLLVIKKDTRGEYWWCTYIGDKQTIVGEILPTDVITTSWVRVADLPDARVLPPDLGKLRGYVPVEADMTNEYGYPSLLDAERSRSGPIGYFVALHEHGARTIPAEATEDPGAQP